jgi:hypothetical protein
MAVNENGNLLDSGNNVAIDHVWGNLPMQPNDEREENGGGLLNAALDNHVIAYAGWNGYPLYEPNTAGVGAGDTVVPNVLGLTTAVATNLLEDAGLVVTVATAAANVAGVVTAAARTAGSGVTTITDASHGFVTGNRVTISSVDATVNGTYSVTRLTDNTFTVTTTATTVLALSAITGAVVAVAGTIKAQSIAAGNTSTAVGAAITITPWATAS